MLGLYLDTLIKSFGLHTLYPDQMRSYTNYDINNNITPLNEIVKKYITY